MQHKWSNEILLATILMIALCLVGCSHPYTPRGNDRELGQAMGGPPDSHGTAPLEPGAVDTGSPGVPPATSPAHLVGPSDPKKGSLSAMLDVTARGSHVVYVIDRSGSMAPYWPAVRDQLIRSIGDLYPDQDFSVVLMDKDQPKVGPVRGALVSGLKKNQGRAATFILQTEPVGTTSPRKALEYAFALLAKADDKPGKVVYFLTDTTILDNTLVDLVKQQAGVCVVTYMVGTGSPETRTTLQEMAKVSNATFKEIPQPRGQ